MKRRMREMNVVRSFHALKSGVFVQTLRCWIVIYRGRLVTWRPTGAEPRGSYRVHRLRRSDSNNHKHDDTHNDTQVRHEALSRRSSAKPANASLASHGARSPRAADSMA